MYRTDKQTDRPCYGEMCSNRLNWLCCNNDSAGLITKSGLSLKYIIRFNTRHNIKNNCFKPYNYLVDVSATAVAFFENESTLLRVVSREFRKRM